MNDSHANHSQLKTNGKINFNQTLPVDEEVYSAALSRSSLRSPNYDNFVNKNQSFNKNPTDLTNPEKESTNEKKQDITSVDATDEKASKKCLINNSPFIKYIFKKVFKVLFSHIGTFFMVVIYMCLGGLLFQYLEGENEVKACFEVYKKFRGKLNASVNRAMSIAQTGLTDSYIEENLVDVLRGFAKDVYTLSYDPHKNCSTIGDPGNWPEWSFPNAVFFSATIMTTIGYGHITPITMWGKIVCIVYTLLGIPIMLLFLTNIGEVMAHLFRFLYINLCCCRCFWVVRPADNSRSVTPSQDTEQAIGQHSKQEIKWESADPNANSHPPEKITIVEDESEYDDWEEDELETVTIPITITLVVLFSYIMIGAALFTIWEKDWQMIDGAYFSFITLSTIGFGDLVPGKNGFEKPETAIEMVVGAMYCLWGLAILSMCLNLIQDEIAGKFKWLGMRLGIVEEEDELDDGASSCHHHQTSSANVSNQDLQKCSDVNTNDYDKDYLIIDKENNLNSKYEKTSSC